MTTETTDTSMSLGEAAYRRLRSDIIACRLAPGQHLTAKELSKQTGFGISPLSEALIRLDHDGLVRILPRKGYQVTPITPKAVDDLFAVWTILGPAMVRIGIARATDEQLAVVGATIEELDRLQYETTAVAASIRRVEISEDVFRGLAIATGNAYLRDLFEKVIGDISRIRTLVLTSDPTAGAELEPTEDWVRQIFAQRDGDAVAEFVRRYLQQLHTRFLQIVVRWPSVMSSEVVPLGNSRQP